MVRIRLNVQGKKHQLSHRLVAVDSRKPRDTGNYLEDLGYYNPHTGEVIQIANKCKNSQGKYNSFFLIKEKRF